MTSVCRHEYEEREYLSDVTITINGAMEKTIVNLRWRLTRSCFAIAAMHGPQRVFDIGHCTV